MEEEDTSRAEKSVSLSLLKTKMEDFANARDWGKFHSPRNLLLALVGEVGELAEIFQWKGEVQKGLPGWSSEEREHLGDELSDVLLYLVRLADICNVNLGEASLKKIEKNSKKYPIEKCKGVSDKYTIYVERDTNTEDERSGKDKHDVETLEKQKMSSRVPEVQNQELRLEVTQMKNLRSESMGNADAKGQD